MERIYLYCALAGGSVVACQFLLSILGLSILGLSDQGDLDDLSSSDFAHAHDIGHDAHSSWFVGVLSFRTVVAAITFFGIAGMAATTNNAAPQVAFVIALAAGISALYLVAWMMRALYALKDDGTIRIENAVGESAIVYLTIPAEQAGRGKIHLILQGRTVEFDAVTSGSALLTGTAVVVVGILNSDTVEVIPAILTEGAAHA